LRGRMHCSRSRSSPWSRASQDTHCQRLQIFRMSPSARTVRGKAGSGL
jgi:hypothetical protein